MVDVPRAARRAGGDGVGPRPRHPPRADGRRHRRRRPCWRSPQASARRGRRSLCAAVLAGQASIGWSNDWLDADRDRAVARTDKPVVQGAVRPGLLRTLALAAAAIGRRPVAAARARAGLLLLVLVASGWAYNAGLKRTPASVVGYVVGFGALPAGVVAAAPGTPIGPVVAGRRRGGARGRRPPGQRRARPRGRPGHRGARPAAPDGRPGVGDRRVRCCSAAPRSSWCSARTGRRRRPAGPGSRWRCRRWCVAALAGTARFRRAAFPAVLLLTVLDVVLLLAGGAALT